MTESLSGALAALETVDWSSFSHAYGQATDVPSMLQDWTSTHPAEHERGDEAIWSSLFHQGDIHTAATPAVPVFAAALRSERSDLWLSAAWFLSAAVAPECGPWWAVCDFDKLGHSVPEAHEATEEVAPVLLEVLGDDRYPDEVRRAVAGVLAWCVDHTDRSLDVSRALVGGLESGELRAAVFLLAGVAASHAQPAGIWWLQPRPGDEREILAAAIARAWAGQDEAGDRETLLQAVRNMSDPDDWRPFGLDDSLLFAADALLRSTFSSGLPKKLSDWEAEVVEAFADWADRDEYQELPSELLASHGLPAPSDIQSVLSGEGKAPPALDTSTLVASLKARMPMRRFVSTALMPSGDIAVCDREGFYILSWANGLVIKSVPLADDTGKNPHGVTVDPGGRFLAVWFCDSQQKWTTQVWNLGTDRLEAVLEGAGKWIGFDAGRSRLVATHADQVLVYDTTTWAPQRSIPQRYACNKFALSPDGELIAVCVGSDFELCETASGRRVIRETGGLGELAWHPDSNILAKGGTRLELLDAAGSLMTAYDLNVAGLCWSSGGDALVVVHRYWGTGPEKTSAPGSLHAHIDLPVSLEITVMPFADGRLSTEGPSKLIDHLPRAVSWHPDGLIIAHNDLSGSEARIWHPDLRRHVSLSPGGARDGVVFWQAYDQDDLPRWSFGFPKSAIEVLEVDRPGHLTPMHDSKRREAFLRDSNSWRNVKEFLR